MQDSRRFNFLEGFDAFGIPDALPKMPLTLTYRNSSIDVSVLLDTGASVNVLPYSMGVQLGAIWEAVTLAGNIASLTADECGGSNRYRS
jgi:hypothetical protein